MRRLALVLLCLWSVSCSSDSSKNGTDASPNPDATADQRQGDIQREVLADVAPDLSTPDQVPSDTGDAGDTTVGPRVEDPIQYINPFIGSGGEGFLIGSGTPAATRPFGMVKLGPDTMDSGSAPFFYHCSGYWYPDQYLLGFSHLHLFGTGAPDYGVLLFNPMNGISDAQTDPKTYRHTFKKENEYAEVGLYRVTTDDGITAELSATERVGLHRYTWETGQQRVVMLDGGHALQHCEVVESELDANVEAKEITGRIKYCGGLSCGHGGFNLYFVARFEQSPVAAGTFTDAHTLRPDLTCEGPQCGAYFDFGKGDGSVDIKVGVSYVDLDGARQNLVDEADTLTLEQAVQQSKDAWRPLLKSVQVDAGGTDDELTIFYTALYHSMFMPDIVSDVDGRYRGMDQQIHNSGERKYYSDFSLWDTFRTLHPLLTLVAPEEQSDMVASLIAMFDQGGAYPRWPIADTESGCMIGTHADIVVSDSYLKDIALDDPEHAFNGLLVTATGPKPAGAVGAERADIEGYLTMGYCRADKAGRSVSWTLEVAHDDYALSQMAKKLGRSEDSAMLLQHSENYRNLWDPQYGFFMPKDSDGSWHPLPQEFDATRWEDWLTEGGAWQYLWYVPHNPDGLAELMGGTDKMLQRLEDFFAISKEYEDNINQLELIIPRPYYWHGNEPDMHAAYLFSAFGRQDLSAKWARWIMRAHYRNDPQGIPGNDDCGTMSSWYVFSAMGFLPIPGTDRYYLGKPLFTDATMKIQGKQLRIIAEGPVTDTAIPVETWLNGVKLEATFLTWDQLKGGGELKFVMQEPQQ